MTATSNRPLPQPELKPLLEAAARTAGHVGDAEWRPDVDLMQAMDLAKSINASIEWNFEAQEVTVTHKPTGLSVTEPHQSDPATASQRALLRLAASFARLN